MISLGTEWKAKVPFVGQNLFTPTTQNEAIRGAYAEALPAPPLHLLDRFRTDEKTCMSVLPFFFLY